MGEPLQFFLLLMALSAGAISIFLSLQQMRRYRIPFVSSYFYYVVFLYIFGAYGLAGSGILGHLLMKMNVEQEVIRSARFYAIFLGIPFLILSNYMLLKSVLEFFKRSLVPAFTAPFFILSTLAFTAYGYFTIRLSRFSIGDYQVLETVQRWVFAAYMTFMYLSVLGVILWFSGSETDHRVKKYIRVFGAQYALYMAVTVALYLLQGIHQVIPFVFLFLFLSWHLAPLLLNSFFLETHHGEGSGLQEDFDTLLERFAARYDISRREREVIRLICKGQSNQQIGDALFISLQTVKDHIHRIFVKSGVRNRVQLTNQIRSA